MVHYEIQAQADALFPALVGQCFQILHGAQLRLYTAEIGHSIAAVAAVFGTFQQGHQVQIVHAALRKIGKFLLNAPQVPGKGVDIEHHAHELVGTKPFRLRKPLGIQNLQRSLSVVKALFQHSAEIGKGFGVAGVNLIVQLLEFLISRLHPLGKDSFHRISPSVFISGVPAPAPFRAWPGWRPCGW